MIWKKIFLWIFFLIFSIVLFISIVKKYYITAGLGFIFLIIILVLVFKDKEIKKPIPKHKVIEEYIKMMEQNYGISINNNWILYRDEQTPVDYVIVLKDIEEESMNVRYFPFECNKFNFIFGRGTGSIKYKVAEVINWLHQNTHINLKPELYVDLTEKARAQTLREMELGTQYAGGEYGEEN